MIKCLFLRNIELLMLKLWSRTFFDKFYFLGHNLNIVLEYFDDTGEPWENTENICKSKGRVTNKNDIIQSYFSSYLSLFVLTDHFPSNSCQIFSKDNQVKITVQSCNLNIFWNILPRVIRNPEWVKTLSCVQELRHCLSSPGWMGWRLAGQLGADTWTKHCETYPNSVFEILKKNDTLFTVCVCFLKKKKSNPYHRVFLITNLCRHLKHSLWWNVCFVKCHSKLLILHKHRCKIICHSVYSGF